MITNLTYKQDAGEIIPNSYEVKKATPNSQLSQMSQERRYKERQARVRELIVGVSGT